MWSGSMSNQGEPFSSQMVGTWALNPSMPYMNMPHEQVDWASLAQQWIKMKEEVPQFDKEGGEAPMEITKEEGSATTPPDPPEWPSTTSADGTWTGNWTWNQAGGGWCWNPVGTHLAKPAAVASTFTPTYPTIPDVSTPMIPPASAFPYTPPQAPTTAETFPANHSYWTGTSSEAKDTTAWDTSRSHKKHPPVEHTSSDIDPAKRKQLPAWIREGLEKMEREKLKKAENERLEKLRKDELARQSELNVVDSNGLIDGHPPKSKFESESDDSDQGNEVAEVIKTKSEEKPRRSRFDWHESSSLIVPQQPKYRSKEQILQTVMVDVRKILTQILMEVTTEEIEKAIDEEIKHFNRKAPATTVRKTAALTSLTGKLGLGIYESDSDSESDPEEKVKNDPDSDQELRNKIEKLKNDFISVEKEIELEAAEQEERERKQLKHESLIKEDSPINREEQVQPLQEDSCESKERHRSDEYSKDLSEQKRRINESNNNNNNNKSEHVKECSSSSTSNNNNNNNNNNSKSGKKLLNSERSYRPSSSSYSSSSESSSSSRNSIDSSSSSRSSNSGYSSRRRRRRDSGGGGGGGGKRMTSTTSRRSSRYSRSRTRSRTRSRSRTRRDDNKSRHRSECRRRSRRSSRDRKTRSSRRSSSNSSSGHHRSRKSNHRR